MRFKKTVKLKFKKVSIWLLSECKVFFDHIYAYYDLPQPIGSCEIIEILQMWLNNPQCQHKEGLKFPIFWWDNHQDEPSHMSCL